MPVINWKVELKLEWSKYSVLLPAGNDNVNDNDSENILFTIKDTKLYVAVLTLSKLLSKGFKRSIYWNQYKTKSQNKNTTNEYGYFLESHFVRVNRLFALSYKNQDVNAKRFKTRRYYLPKETTYEIAKGSYKAPRNLPSCFFISYFTVSVPPSINMHESSNFRIKNYNKIINRKNF